MTSLGFERRNSADASAWPPLTLPCDPPRSSESGCASALERRTSADPTAWPPLTLSGDEPRAAEPGCGRRRGGSRKRAVNRATGSLWRHSGCPARSDEGLERAPADAPERDRSESPEAPEKLHEQLHGQPPAEDPQDRAAEAAGAFLRRLQAPPLGRLEKIQEDRAAQAAAAFLGRFSATPQANSVDEAVRSSDEERGERRRLVRFDLLRTELHEITPYGEIYGRHPREFVFDNLMNMRPALGARGFVGADDDDFREESEHESDSGSESF